MADKRVYIAQIKEREKIKRSISLQERLIPLEDNEESVEIFLQFQRIENSLDKIIHLSRKLAQRARK